MEPLSLAQQECDDDQESQWAALRALEELVEHEEGKMAIAAAPRMRRQLRFLHDPEMCGVAKLILDQLPPKTESVAEEVVSTTEPEA
eukprot:SAG22_NODE_1416_length_4469_cov_3.239930_6_plen_86_part_01